MSSGLSLLGVLLAVSTFVCAILKAPDVVVGGFAMLTVPVYLGGLVCGILGRCSLPGKIGLSVSAFGLCLLAGMMLLGAYAERIG